MGFRIKIVYSNGESEIGYGTDLSKVMRAYVLDSLIDKCSDQVDDGVQGEQSRALWWCFNKFALC